MLANIYMNWFLKYWRLTGRGEVFRAHVVAYADDFVIESVRWRPRPGVDDGSDDASGKPINEVKTSLKNAGKNASTSSATRSDLTVLKQTENGI